MMAYTTGMRRGEIVTLKWDSVDLLSSILGADRGFPESLGDGVLPHRSDEGEPRATRGDGPGWCCCADGAATSDIRAALADIEANHPNLYALGFLLIPSR